MNPDTIDETPKGTRNGNATARKTLETARLAQQAAEWRSKGYSYRQIGDMQGCSASTAKHRVDRAYASIPHESTEEAKRLELSRLDTIERCAWKVLERHHFVIITGGEHAGDVVYHPQRPDEPLEDDAPVLQAIDRILRVSESRRKLLGIDAPSRSRVEVITGDMIDNEIAKLEAEIARRSASDAGPAATAGVPSETPS